MFTSHISPTNHSKLVKLVGQRCEVRCKIDGILSKSLWDTGAMVSVVSRKWLSANVPDAELRDVRELLDEPLELRTANKNSLPYSGWVEMQFELTSGGAKLSVPFLVVDSEIDRPIIGFNVIIEILKNKDFSLIDELVSAMDVDKKKAECVVSLLESIIERDFVSEVKSDKRNMTIPAGHAVKIKGRVKTENIDAPIPVIFEPDELREWPESLTINEKVLMLCRGQQCVCISVKHQSA